MFKNVTWPFIKPACLAAAFFCFSIPNGGCHQTPWTHWHAYAGHFINGAGRVVDASANDRTTSEGQSYAMFFSLADNDRAHFDSLLNWTENNLADGDMSKHLPGWLWGKAPDGEWKLLDPNSAADADCWIAYSLVEAGRLWKSPRYAQLGRQMMDQIAAQEVADLPGFGPMLMPGPTPLWVHNNAWTLNPSYLPLFVFERFAQLDPQGPWGAIAGNIPRLLHESARRGFAMDWVDYMPDDGFYPAAVPGGQPSKPLDPPDAPRSASLTAKNAPEVPPQSDPKPPMGSYDAIRVYLWAGMIDRRQPTRADLLDAISGMIAYLATPDHPAPPEVVTQEGIPQPQQGPVGFTAAVLPCLWGNPDLARVAVHQRVNIRAQLDASTGLYGKNPVYYDQNLVLFAMGYLDGRFRFGPQGELKVEWTV